MPVDSNMKLSVRPKPLRALFSKYAAQIAPSSQPVRPLGTVRRPSSSQSSGLQNLTEQELSDLERVCLYLAGGGMDGNRIPYLTSAKYLADALHSARGQKNLPRLSKSQTFENQYKLAASRDGLSTPRTPSKSKAKRLITLPLYQVKVNTNTMELEDSQAVESTRKSLRNLMEVGKIKASHPENRIVPANIQNFPFSNLTHSKEFGSTRSLQTKFSKSTDQTSETPNVVASVPTLSISNEHGIPFENLDSAPTKSFDVMNYTRNSRSLSDKTSDTGRPNFSRTETDSDRLDVRFESVAYTMTEKVGSPTSRGRTLLDSTMKGECLDEQHTVTSPATLASTSTTKDFLHVVAPFVHSTTGTYRDSLRVGSGPGESPSPAQVWPSLRDIHKMKVEACRQASKARRQRRHANSSTTSSNSSAESLQIKTNPTFRYTQQHSQPHLSRAKVLDPIVVPSHSHMDCPMCNAQMCIPDSSSCPPNSPTQLIPSEERSFQGKITVNDLNVIRVPCGDNDSETLAGTDDEVDSDNVCSELVTQADEASSTNEVQSSNRGAPFGKNHRRPSTGRSQESPQSVLVMPKVSMKYFSN